VPKVQVHNYTGSPLDAEEGSNTYVLPIGSSSFTTSANTVGFTRADSTSFDVPIQEGRTDITVYAGGYSKEESGTVAGNFLEGMGFGLVLLGTALGLRLLKSVGYHSQDI
jgi:hypothetical protein